jgi:hypothetical protein
MESKKKELAIWTKRTYLKKSKSYSSTSNSKQQISRIAKSNIRKPVNQLASAVPLESEVLLLPASSYISIPPDQSPSFPRKG